MVSSQCVRCPVATYKDNTVDPLTQCLSCPVGYLTATDASTSQSDCSIRTCFLSCGCWLLFRFCLFVCLFVSSYSVLSVIKQKHLLFQLYDHICKREKKRLLSCLFVSSPSSFLPTLYFSVLFVKYLPFVPVLHVVNKDNGSCSQQMVLRSISMLVQDIQNVKQNA